VVATAKNNGHSYAVSFSGFTECSTPTISYGGLPGKFKLVGFHFHWGNQAYRGSEHRLNYRSYSGEVREGVVDVRV
jgi:hypothetical protein